MSEAEGYHRITWALSGEDFAAAQPRIDAQERARLEALLAEERRAVEALTRRAELDAAELADLREQFAAGEVERDQLRAIISRLNAEMERTTAELLRLRVHAVAADVLDQDPRALLTLAEAADKLRAEVAHWRGVALRVEDMRATAHAWAVAAMERCANMERERAELRALFNAAADCGAVLEVTRGPT